MTFCYVVRVKHRAVLNSVTAFIFTAIIRHVKCIITSKLHPVERKVYCILLLHYFVLITLIVNLHFFAPYCLQSSIASGSAAICTIVVHIARYASKNAFESKCVCIFYLQLLFETFLISRSTQTDISKNVFRSSCTMYNVKCTMYNVSHLLPIFNHN